MSINQLSDEGCRQEELNVDEMESLKMLK